MKLKGTQMTLFGFASIKSQVSSRFEELVRLNGNKPLFLLDVDGDTLWDVYLGNFDENVRQEHNCNACRQFIKRYGNIAAIDDDYNIHTLWSFTATDSEYRKSIDALNVATKDAPIAEAFLTDVAKLGIDQNPQRLENGEIKIWQHYYFELPKNHPSVVKRSVELSTKRNLWNGNYHVFRRSMLELSMDAYDTVLDLIESNTLYRGQEQKQKVETLRKKEIEVSSISWTKSEAFYWANAVSLPEAICRVRNSAIGTLLIDLSEGKELEEAVQKWELVMAPFNYQRPKAIFTAKMLQDATKKLEENGLLDSLGRVFAQDSDIDINHVLYVDRSVAPSLKNSTLAVLEELQTQVTSEVTEAQLKKATEISVNEFLTGILPKSTSLEVLLENRLQSRLCTLTAPANPTSPSLFKWSNPYAWSYRNGYSDALVERVKKAGGYVDGIAVISLGWHNGDDLDAHLLRYENSSLQDHIYFGNKYWSNWTLDVDMNAGSPDNSVDPVENISVGAGKTPEPGTYSFQVNQYSLRSHSNVGFTVRVKLGDEVRFYEYTKEVAHKETVSVIEFEYKNGRYTILKEHLPCTSSLTKSTNVWNIDTNKFHSVKMILNSPNIWGDKPVGHNHLIFSLKGCIAPSNEVVGFLNEYIRPDFEVHKRVFEALAQKTKLPDNNNQVSGLGFSTTARNNVYIKADKRIYNVKF